MPIFLDESKPGNVAEAGDQQREIAIGHEPLGEHGVDDRLRGGADDQRLLQQLAPAVGDHGQLGGEARDVLRFLLQERLWNEEGEVGVLVSGVLDPSVKPRLDLLPDGTVPPYRPL